MPVEPLARVGSPRSFSRGSAARAAAASSIAAHARTASSPTSRGAPALMAVSQVGGLDPLVLEELLGVVGHGDAAGLHDVAAVGQLERRAGILLDEEDGRTLLVELLDDLEDAGHDERRQ